MNYSPHKKLLLLLVLLFVQYWLGMSLNLFGDVPAEISINFLGHSGGIELLAHTVIGTIILLISFTIPKQAAIFPRLLSYIASAFVAAAVFSGFAFLLRGQDNSFSMAMAMSFILIYTIYLYIISIMKNDHGEIPISVISSSGN